AGLALGCSRRSAAAAAAGGPAQGGPVPIVEFSDDGRRLRLASLPRVVKTDAEWRRQLSPLSYTVTRREGTERAFTGPLLEEHRKGVFRCLCCDTALFDAATKFESGTGWPSFWQPIAPENIVEDRDFSLGMIRTEVACARCDAHRQLRRSEEHTSELQSRENIVCRLLLEKKNGRRAGVPAAIAGRQ